MKPIYRYCNKCKKPMKLDPNDKDIIDICPTCARMLLKKIYGEPKD